jgi:hypothetical protein
MAEARAREEGKEQALFDLLNLWLLIRPHDYDYHTSKPAGERREELLKESKKACEHRKTGRLEQGKKEGYDMG